ncbi:MAG: hypothetical protein ABH867_04675 [Patescibacteria group bacterium]|nr:hypothetical protein [Patescibacteria group bacterium]
MKNSKILIILGVLLIAVGVGSFYGGMKYQQGKQPSRADFQSRAGARQQNLPAGVRQRMGTGSVRGEIISQDKKSITVKLPDDSSRIIFVGDSVQINKSAPGTKDDLVEGVRIFVTGSENPDGSITARNIQINPA